MKQKIVPLYHRKHISMQSSSIPSEEHIIYNNTVKAMQLMPIQSSIPRSSSDPSLSRTICSRSRRPSNSNHSPSSTPPSKSKYSLRSPILERIINGIKSQSLVASRRSYLKEKDLEAHNRRIAAINVDDAYSNSTPYYKGVYYDSLITKTPKLTSGISSGRKSDSDSVATSSSLSTFIFRIRDLSSNCFSVKIKRDETSKPATYVTMESAGHTPFFPSSSPSASSPRATVTVLKEMSKIAEERKETTVGDVHALLAKEKPLPERVAEPAAVTTVVMQPSKSNPMANEYSPFLTQTPSASAAPRTKTRVLKEMSEGRNEIIGKGDVNDLLVEKKLLRESAEKPAPKIPTGLVLQPSKSKDRIINEKDGNKKMRKNREFLWANKYQPKALDDFICNREKAMELLALIREGGCGHIIFEGPPGVGKRTMIWAMLGEAFGPDRVQARDECKAFNLKGEMLGKIQVNVKQSPQHIEVNLSELKGYEKHVVVELIKETQNMISNKGLLCDSDNCRAIILYEAEKLSTDALLYIKWLLERYKGCNKVFFCCSDLSKLEPIKTICTVVQLVPPSRKEIVEVLEFIAKQEGIELPHRLAEKFAEKSKNNLRQAIRSFEASWLANYPFQDDLEILTGWEDDIANIAKNIVEEQSPKQLYMIRGMLQNLIEHDVSPDSMFKFLVKELKKHAREELKQQIDKLYEEYSRVDENLFESQKLAFANNKSEETGKGVHEPMRRNIVQQFLRIEEFIARFMSCYKSSITTNKSVQH
ncbi:uncharacterized protein LOC121244619 isoform X1 [Juglans microcarpa x Juglans regia]|uniref:uncharacterized protein LOC121244619 isoform X1 n=1 Tax=Juglans microcarpa x Juglans regia TaxID=2249226 RepID=UPI001B7EB423|nr:uncharacterized protein LOC121244619 isoform X1 [Juglans microcarpa x Juglans regia]